MARSASPLPWILGGAIGLGGVLQGLHWKSSRAEADPTTTDAQLRMVLEENELLKRENESLRSLAQGGGEFPVDQEYIDHVESEIGLDFLSQPVVHRIAGEELRDRITAAVESRLGPSGVDDRQEAWVRMGWLRASDNLLYQLAAVQAVGASGWFDETSGEAWVTDRFQISEIPDQAVLLRLLTRILLHQHFPLPPRELGDDAARAREALHQGAAVGTESRFLATKARDAGFLPMRDNPEVGHLMAGLSPFMRSIATFPLEEGKALADALFVQGREIFLRAFRNPPQTTREILLAETVDGMAAGLVLPELPEAPYLTESGGMLGVRQWLAASDQAEMAVEISREWKADRYALVPDGEASTAVIWEIEFRTSEAAKKWVDVAVRHCAAMDAVDREGGLNNPMRSAHQVAPTRVRYVNAATNRFFRLVGAR